MKRISLWLIPCEKDYLFLDKQIKEIKNKFNGGELFPHVSLPFSLKHDSVEIVKRLNENKMNKIELKISKIGVGFKTHQQVFLEFEQNKDLSLLTTKLLKTFSGLIVKRIGVRPHLSMIYSDNVGIYSIEEKEKIIKKIKMTKSINIDKIALVDLSSEKVADWKIIDEINLN